MLFPRNMHHGRIATSPLAIALIITVIRLVIAPVAVAGVSSSDGQQALPDAADSVNAYLTVRDWIDVFRPPPPDDDAARIRVADATGVCVHLRHSGRVIGTGIVASPRATEADRHLMFRRAVGRAMAQVLGDPAVKNLPDDVKDRIGRSLTLELEVAGPLEPLIGRSFDSLAQRLEPGVDGVAMRRGDDWAMLFPARLLATNTAGAIRTRLPAMVTELGLEITDDLGALRDDHRVSVYRFRTTHLTQISPNGVPFETFRGDAIVSPREVTTGRLATFADDLAARMLSAIWPRDPLADDPMRRAALGMMGDYHAISDTYQPLIAPPLEQALTAYALLRYSSTDGAAEETSKLALQGARRLLEELAEVEIAQDDPRDDPAASAAVVLAVRELPEQMLDESIATFEADAMTAVIESFDPVASRFVRRVGDDREQTITPHHQALIAAAMADRLKHSDTPHHADGVAKLQPVHVRAAIDAAWESVSEAEWVTLLPWIALAELDYADATDSTVGHRDRFDSLRAMFAAIELGTEALAGERDLHGGLRLAGERRPTSQTVRPASFLAVALADGRLIPSEETDAAEMQQRRIMRFLIQLSVREQTAWSVRNSARARGGIRAAVWDATQPAAAQPLALLTTVETLRALRDR